MEHAIANIEAQFEHGSGEHVTQVNPTGLGNLVSEATRFYLQVLRMTSFSNNSFCVYARQHSLF